MAGFRIDFSRAQTLNANSEVRSGAKLAIYANTTTTPLALYSDSAASVSAANPIVADSSGSFPVRYVGTDAAFTWALFDADDVPIWSNDGIEPTPNVDDADLANYARLDGADFTGLANWAPQDSVASGTTINADALDSNYATVTGTTTIANITLADGAERLFIFAGICTLTNSSTLKLGGRDITTRAGMMLRFIGETGGVTRLSGGITETGRAIFESCDIQYAISDETTALTVGTAKRTFRAPGLILLDATIIPRLSLTTASSSGVVTVDCKVGGVSIFSTLLSCDANETTSTTAATPAVMTATSIVDDGQITFDITTAGTNAAGAKVTLYGKRLSL